ncbi:MAG: carbonic anhydrase [bacterium]
MIASAINLTPLKRDLSCTVFHKRKMFMSPSPLKTLTREEFLKTIEEILNSYLLGNERFASGDAEHPHQDAETLCILAIGQEPPCVGICCMDSRVGVGTTHDQGLGQILLNRLAGNIITDEVIGGFEYAVQHGSRLLIVEGHSSCGAVTAAVKSILAGQKVSGKLGKIVEALRPAVEEVKTEMKKEDKLKAIVKAIENEDFENVLFKECIDRASQRNVELGVQKIITESLPLKDALQNGQIAIVGTFYDVETMECEPSTRLYQHYMNNQEAFDKLLDNKIERKAPLSIPATPQAVTTPENAHNPLII